MAKYKKKDFTFCVADIYEDNTYLTSVKIWGHNTLESYIEVQSSPVLTVGKLCNVLIRTSPDPCTFKGRVRIFRGRTAIMLFGSGQNIVINNLRQMPRFKTDVLAYIEGSVYCDKIYPLHTKTEVTIIDISRGGGRLKACNDCVRPGDKLMIRLHEKIADISTLFLEVVNCDERQGEYSEYGCRFIMDAEIFLKPAAETIQSEIYSDAESAVSKREV